ncbi:carboxypeptidase-like regulatory domain-containing protein [Hymenobacter nivis]|nr:carboxypeptidase-like regulatory domain-containing protein [Hymenobacter nivis]
MKTQPPHYWLFGFCWAVALLSGCGKKNQDPAPTTGIAGTVQVLDQNSKGISKDGVTVTVLNTTPVLTATTNDAGEFIIGAVPAGTYTLVFAKPGLSTFVLIGAAHPQAEVITRLPETYTLVQEPTVRASALQATNLTARTGGGGPVQAVEFKTTVTTPQPELRHSYVLYFGTTPDVSYLTATGSIALYSGSSQASTAYLSTWTMSRSDLLDRGFSAASGTKAYAVAYGVGLAGSLYTDLVTGNKVDWPGSNLTPSPIVSFTMP